MDNNFNMTFEESQDYIAKRGLDIPWNDCDVFVDEREINRTIGNVLKWADKTMIEKACKWLINIDFDDYDFRDCDETFNNDLFVDAFCKAMRNE